MRVQLTERSFEGRPVETVTLVDESGGHQATIAPWRGAIVTSFVVAGRELLYLDAATLDDPAKNVRGGIPVLFPSPGKLEADTWRRGERTGTLRQHGFARSLPWARTRLHADQTSAEVTLRLDSSAVTLAAYPWAFEMELTFTLSGSCLTIASRVTHRATSPEPMPFALGFHPYFVVEDKRRASLELTPTRIFDNVTKQYGPFKGFDLTAPEVDVHCLDHPSTKSALVQGDGSHIEIRGSRDFATWVVWTVAGKDFVCLEPWTAPGNALNSGEHLCLLEPGGVHVSRVEIEWSPR